jgi:hypothetical protein
MKGTVTGLWHSKQLISVTMIAHTTEEQVTSVVMSHNSRRAVRSSVAMWSGTGRTIVTAMEHMIHPIHINRGMVFSVGSASRLYHLTDQVEFS